MSRISWRKSTICASTCFRALTSFKTNALHSLINTPLIDRNAWVCSSPDLSFFVPRGCVAVAWRGAVTIRPSGGRGSDSLVVVKRDCARDAGLLRVGFVFVFVSVRSEHLVVVAGVRVAASIRVSRETVVSGVVTTQPSVRHHAWYSRDLHVKHAARQAPVSQSHGLRGPVRVDTCRRRVLPDAFPLLVHAVVFVKETQPRAASVPGLQKLAVAGAVC
mmetsp:Transcript_7254/g.24283  ORF Transcript_7254/g.24283 Transcript_7254/m.24283 type:complete len:218 (-) Transcript_7254:441-1094(-)